MKQRMKTMNENVCLFCMLFLLLASSCLYYETKKCEKFYFQLFQSTEYTDKSNSVNVNLERLRADSIC
jgi:hypothetical protein